MVKKALFAGLIAGFLMCGTGCGVFQTILWHPFGPGTLCDPSHCCGCPECVTSCGPSCGPSCTQCGPACEEAVCDPCGESRDVCCEPACDACGPCGDPCMAGPCCGRPCGPLTWLFALFGPGCYYGDCCRGGCGEIYWGDFHGDPHDCCDPCNRMGDFTGGGCPTCVGCPTGTCTHSYAGTARPTGATHSVVQSSPTIRPAPEVSTSSNEPDLDLPPGAKLISQSDRAVGPTPAKEVQQAKRSGSSQTR